MEQSCPSLERQIQEIKEQIDVLVASSGTPGAIISVRSEIYGSWDWEYGYANIETKQLMNTELLFRIGSVTKTFTGTIFLQAYDLGLISNLDAPISSCYLGIPNGNTITIREVGSMRSGIYNYIEGINAFIDSHPRRVWQMGELLSLGVTHAPYFPPGTGYHYSNTNTVILAGSLERLFDMPIGEIITERLIKPLGLKNTYFSEYLTDVNSVTGYVIQDGEYVPVTGYNSSWAWAAGEIISNVHDMHRYAKLSIALGKTLSKNALAQQRYWQTTLIEPDGSVFKYGFQMANINDYEGHTGAIPGFSACVLGSTKRKTTIVISCNLELNSEGVNITSIIAGKLTLLLNAIVF